LDYGVDFIKKLVFIHPGKSSFINNDHDILMLKYNVIDALLTENYKYDKNH